MTDTELDTAQTFDVTAVCAANYKGTPAVASCSIARCSAIAAVEDDEATTENEAVVGSTQDGCDVALALDVEGVFCTASNCTFTAAGSGNYMLGGCAMVPAKASGATHVNVVACMIAAAAALLFALD